jgi:hypothetical protein
MELIQVTLRFMHDATRTLKSYRLLQAARWVWLVFQWQIFERLRGIPISHHHHHHHHHHHYKQQGLSHVIGSGSKRVLLTSTTF